MYAGGDREGKMEIPGNMSHITWYKNSARSGQSRVDRSTLYYQDDWATPNITQKPHQGRSAELA